MTNVILICLLGCGEVYHLSQGWTVELEHEDYDRHPRPQVTRRHPVEPAGARDPSDEDSRVPHSSTGLTDTNPR